MDGVKEEQMFRLIPNTVKEIDIEVIPDLPKDSPLSKGKKSAAIPFHWKEAEDE
jgi:hypothetical protein